MSEQTQDPTCRRSDIILSQRDALTILDALISSDPETPRHPTTQACIDILKKAIRKAAKRDAQEAAQ
jgi:hypothetical protein